MFSISYLEGLSFELLFPDMILSELSKLLPLIKFFSKIKELEWFRVELINGFLQLPLIASLPLNTV